MLKRILVVESQRVVQLGLEILIKESMHNIEVDFALRLPEALEFVKNNVLDLIVIDLHSPSVESSKVIGKFRKIQPQIKIIVFTGLQEKIYAPFLMQLGADNFVSKNNEEATLLKAIQTALFSNRGVICRQKNHLADSDKLAKLSTREHEVMALLMQGKFTNEIARGLKLKPATISTYKSRIYEKLNVDNVIDLITKVNIYNTMPVKASN